MLPIGRRWFLLPVAVLWWLSGSAAAQVAPPLFEDGPPGLSAAAAGQSLRPDVRRARVAIVRGDRLEAALQAPLPGGPPPFILNLFDDVALTVVTDRVEHDLLGHAIWVGRVVDDPLSAATITWKAGEMTAQVQAGSAYYGVRVSNGQHVIEELDPPSGIVEPAPRIAPPPGPAEARDGGAPLAPPAQGSPDITILVLYTAAAATGAGGTSSIQAAIAQAVTETNTALQASALAARIVLVGAEALAYTQGADVDADLDHISASPTVAGRRNALSADLVSLIVDRNPSGGGGSFTCGIAWLFNGNANSGFSVVERECLFPNYSFAHEVVHNLGGNHAPDDCFFGGVDQCGNPTYARGFKDPAAPTPFRTLMAYECQGPVSCPRVLHYSSRSVLYTSRPTGNSNQDNARRIGETAATAAGYRGGGGGGTPPAPPTGLNSSVNGPNATLSWMGSAGATSYILQVGTFSGGSNAFNQSVGGATTVSGTAPPGTYFWRVRAQNSAGTSAPSAETSFTIAGLSVPGVPGALQVVVNGGNISISWGAASGATSHRLEAGTGPGLTNIAAIPIAGTSFSVGGVPPGTYYVRVRGVGPGGVGPPTADAVITVASSCVPPGPPSSLTSTVVGRNVTLNWQQAATGTPPITYSIVVGSSSGGSNIGTFPVGGGSSVSVSAPPGTYFARLVANNACGTSTPSNEAVVVVP
jgi:hypothetical protein